MARKPSRPEDEASTPRNIAASDKPPREKIVDAFMALLADKPFEDITPSEIAASAGLTLADVRGEFGSPLAIVAAFMKDIDRAVLSKRDEDLGEEPARERLFDILMQRFEALAPYKAAIRSLARSATRNPGLAFALNGLSVRSQQWMLAAADIGSSGPKGLVRAQGLSMIFSSVARTWLKDEDEGHARTMAALDRALARGQGFARLLDDIFMIPEAACRIRSRFRGRRRDAWDDDRDYRHEDHRPAA